MSETNKDKKNKELLKIPASINKISTMADSTLKLSIYTTRELTSNDELKIMSYRNKEGIMVFSPKDIKQEDMVDLPEVPKDMSEKRTPSQKMRAIIYRIWEQTTSQKQEFETYYRNYMMKLNEHLKQKLN